MGKQNEVSTKEQLIDNLLNIIDVKDDFFKNLYKLLDVQYGDLLSERQREQIGEYCERNMKRLITKKEKLYKEFYQDFTEDELSDIIIYQNSKAGQKMREKSKEHSEINQEILVDIINHKNLNMLISKMLADSGLDNDESSLF